MINSHYKNIFNLVLFIQCTSVLLTLYFSAVLKTILSYLAYLKVEVQKISDTQQEIIQTIHNSRSNVSTFNSWTGEIDYFVTAWPISNHNELKNLENKLHANEQDFKNKVVCTI